MTTRILVAGAKHVGKTTIIDNFNRFNKSNRKISLFERTPYEARNNLYKRCHDMNGVSFHGMLILFNAHDLNKFSRTHFSENSFEVAKCLSKEAYNTGVPHLLYGNMIDFNDNHAQTILCKLGIGWLHHNCNFQNMMCPVFQTDDQIFESSFRVP